MGNCCGVAGLGFFSFRQRGFQPADIIDQLNLRRPIFSKTTNYGHFGKNDKDLTWEATNKVSALLKAI